MTGKREAKAAAEILDGILDVIPAARSGADARLRAGLRAARDVLRQGHDEDAARAAAWLAYKQAG
jgi:hypothetical protein